MKTTKELVERVRTGIGRNSPAVTMPAEAALVELEARLERAEKERDYYRFQSGNQRAANAERERDKFDGLYEAQAKVSADLTERVYKLEEAMSAVLDFADGRMTPYVPIAWFKVRDHARAVLGGKEPMPKARPPEPDPDLEHWQR